jgi:putative SOS response-associated peptidase YedK
MCGRYTIIVTLEELLRRYDVSGSIMPSHMPRYNVAPGQMVMSVINDGERNRLGQLRWGLIPEWAKDERVGYKMLNARAETLAEKPAFRNSFQRKRCLIPADSFYDWKQTDKGKQPMRILLKSQEIFSLAGLYDTWTSPDGSKISTCTVITTKSNEMMAEIHDRMPVILRPQEESIWLDREISQTDVLLPLLRPYATDEMYAYPVSDRVGNVRNDDEACVEHHLLTSDSGSKFG